MTMGQMIVASWVFVAGLLVMVITSDADPCDLRELVAKHGDLPRWYLWATSFVAF